MENQEREDLNKIRHYKGTVKDFKNYWDEMAGTETNAFGTPEYQGFNDVHPTRGANDSEHWKTSNVTEDTDVGHVDNEPGMLANDLSVIERYAKELGEMMKQLEMQGEVDLPHWWQSKVILAKEYLVKAKHYLRAELEGGVNEGWGGRGGSFTDNMDDDQQEVYYRVRKLIKIPDGGKKDIKDWKELDAYLKKDKAFKKLPTMKQRYVQKALSWVITYYWEMER